MTEKLENEGGAELNGGGLRGIATGPTGWDGVVEVDMGSGKKLLPLGEEGLIRGKDKRRKAKGNKRAKFENVKNEGLSKDNL